jgi:PAS domain-containing protein
MSSALSVPVGFQDPLLQFEVLFRSSPYGAVLLDQSTRLLACNEVAREIYGLPEGIAEGRGFLRPDLAGRP